MVRSSLDQPLEAELPEHKLREASQGACPASPGRCHRLLCCCPQCSSALTQQQMLLLSDKTNHDCTSIMCTSLNSDVSILSPRCCHLVVFLPSLTFSIIFPILFLMTVPQPGYKCPSCVSDATLWDVLSVLRPPQLLLRV